MCWKYEKEYDVCFDFLFFEDTEPKTFNDDVYALLRHYDVVVKDKDKFKEEFLAMLSRMHETGIIVPYEQNTD